jgi:hypothetical protein
MALHKKSKTSGDIEFFSAVLCVSLRPLRLKSPFNAEIAEIRREPQRKYSTFCAKPLFIEQDLPQPLQHFLFIRAACAANHVNKILFERDWSFTVALQAYAFSQLIQRAGSK